METFANLVDNRSGSTTWGEAMPICDDCGNEYPAGEGVWGNGDYICGECVAAHIEKTEGVVVEPTPEKKPPNQ